METFLKEFSVVFGKVLKGMGLVKYLEIVETSNDRPLKDCTIMDCGELKEGEDDGIVNKKSEDGDEYPDFVEDSDVSTVEDRLKASNAIRKIGNDFFVKKDFNTAKEKYEKALRYLNSSDFDGEDEKKLESEEVVVNGNLSAALLYLGKNQEVIRISTSILRSDPKNVKALMRRGQAQGKYFLIFFYNKV
jgi:peptidyl-prolyl isomerase D